jgi:hypothetical protein
VKKIITFFFLSKNKKRMFTSVVRKDIALVKVHRVCQSGKVLELKSLLSVDGTRLNINELIFLEGDECPQTLLMRACWLKSPEMAELIIADLRVDLHVTDKLNRTALWICAFLGQADIIKVFLNSNRPLPYNVKALPHLVPKISLDVDVGDETDAQPVCNTNPPPSGFKQSKKTKVKTKKTLVEQLPACTPQGVAERRGYSRVIEILEICDTPDNFELKLPQVPIKVVVPLACLFTATILCHLFVL